MKLIVGLGNPGFRYRATRHNIGYMVLDNVAADLGIKLKEKLFSSLCGRGKIDDQEVLLAKPLSYMNLSGKVVYEIRQKEDLSLEDLLIVTDDVDLPFGKIRLRPVGSSGGHKGLQSIIEELQTEEFSRLRVGIGRENERFLSDYVLAPFKKEEKKLLADLIEKASLSIKTWLQKGIVAAMNGFNS